MTSEKHKQRHLFLHKMLDELVADYILHNKGQRASSTYVMHLLQWSYKQAKNPIEHDDHKHEETKYEQK